MMRKLATLTAAFGKRNAAALSKPYLIMTVEPHRKS